MTNPLELNFTPIDANQWLDWSRSYWRTERERQCERWAHSYPSNSEWAKRLGLRRETMWHWSQKGVSRGQTSGWSILFHELEGPNWQPLDLEPMPRKQLQQLIDVMGSVRSLASALRLNKDVIVEWCQSDGVSTSFGYSALLRWLHKEMGLTESPPSVGVINGVRISPKIAAFIHSQARQDVPSRMIALRTGCSHTTVHNVLRRDK